MSASGDTNAPTTSIVRKRRRMTRYTTHASIDTTLIAKWIPSTGHTCHTSDDTTMCAA